MDVHDWHVGGLDGQEPTRYWPVWQEEMQVWHWRFELAVQATVWYWLAPQSVQAAQDVELIPPQEPDKYVPAAQSAGVRQFTHTGDVVAVHWPLKSWPDAHWSCVTHGAHTVFAWSVQADVWYCPLAHEPHCEQTGFNEPLQGPLRK